MIVMHALKEKIRHWGRELGFDAIGFAGVHLPAADANLNAWLAAGCHGTMDYMAAHGRKRSHPAELVPGTRSIITARINYQPLAADNTLSGAGGMNGVTNDATNDARRAIISRYAWGRDYHKLVRNRLQKLAERMLAEIGEFSYRAFADSAPVMEEELAAASGLGWRGKHTLLLDRDAGSYFFLGELFTSLELPADAPVTDHCGTCTACLDSCPTAAFDGPGRLDARRCISYLTIELKEAIPEALRPLLGNRIYGCDDCQTACPWNRFAPVTRETDFLPREGLDRATLVELFAWTEEEFERRLQGSPIRRIGHERWLRNIAVGMGNALRGKALRSDASNADNTSDDLVAALQSRADHPSPLVREHVAWALAQ